MSKTMVEFFEEHGPQGWVDDPPNKNDPNIQDILDLEEALEGIDEELEDIELEKNDLLDREYELMKLAQVYEKRLKALRGHS